VTRAVILALVGLALVGCRPPMSDEQHQKLEYLHTLSLMAQPGPCR
jgi:hypothetical protein